MGGDLGSIVHDGLYTGDATVLKDKLLRIRAEHDLVALCRRARFEQGPARGHEVGTPLGDFVLAVAVRVEV